MIEDVTGDMLDELQWSDEDVERAERELAKARKAARKSDGRCTCRYDDDDRQSARHALAQALSELAAAHARRAEAVAVYDEARKKGKS